MASLLAIAALASAALLHAQPTAPPTQPSEADRQLVETACAACHDIGQVRAKHQDAQGWAGTVDKMIGLGAQIPEDDRDRVIAYLVAHQGPQ